jgi:pilus assembly protein CpaF
LEQTDLSLAAAEIHRLVDRLVTPSGGRVDPASPIADARLADGTRVCAVGVAVAPDGPVVALRRFVERALPIDAFGGPEVGGLLEVIVRRHLNVLVFGGTGAGKTSLLNALAGMLDPSERVITIEDTAELRLPNANLVRLEARAPNAEGAGEVSIGQLLRAALRLRPDRILVGEVRGAEAADLLAALSTGHRGGLSTIHAGSAAEAIDRFEELVVSADGLRPPGGMLRSRLCRTVDVLVGVGRGAAGRRRVFGVWEPSNEGLFEPLWEPGRRPEKPSRDRRGVNPVERG